jgi:transcriptional regulator with XRE-family HTH domain
MNAVKSDPIAVVTIRQKMRQAAKDSGLTLEEIGLRMGFSKDSARKAVSRLLNQEAEYDPRLSTLLAFSAAIGKAPKSLF